jgi:hypothetical protein
MLDNINLASNNDCQYCENNPSSQGMPKVQPCTQQILYFFSVKMAKRFWESTSLKGFENLKAKA